MSSKKHNYKTLPTNNTWYKMAEFLVDCLQSSLSVHTSNFLKVVVHVIIIDQCKQTVHLYEIKVTVMYSRVTLVVVTS